MMNKTALVQWLSLILLFSPGLTGAAAYRLAEPTPTPLPEDVFYREYFRKGEGRLPEPPAYASPAATPKPLSTSTPIPPRILLQEEIRQLIHNLGAEHYIRSSAIERLVTIGSPAVPAIRRALKKEYAYSRVGALHALGYIRDPSSIPDILPLLKDAVPVVRMEAAKTLGQFRNPATLEPLAGALNDPDDKVRCEAVLSLAKSGVPQSRRILLDVLVNNRPVARKAAAGELAEFGDDETVLALGLSANQDSDLAVRIQAIRALGEIGTPASQAQLKRLAGAKNLLLRKTALQALGKE